jgi:hypothetical protein
MANIQCGHCWKTHQTIAQVRECSAAHKGGTEAPPWWSSKVKAQPKRDRSPSLPTDVKVNADGVVTWTNPKHNPWKDIHHEAEQDYTGGEYTRRKARTAVENEYRGTDQYGWLCPNAKCKDGYCHYRATVNASWCPSCNTGVTAGSGEVFSKGHNFEPAQWYLLRIAKWMNKRAWNPEHYNAGWDLIAEGMTMAEVVDYLREHDGYNEKRAIKALQELVDLKREQADEIRNA